MWRKKNELAPVFSNCGFSASLHCGGAARSPGPDQRPCADADCPCSAGRFLEFSARLHRGGAVLHRPLLHGGSGPGDADGRGRHDFVWSGSLCGRGSLRHGLGLHIARGGERLGRHLRGSGLALAGFAAGLCHHLHRGLGAGLCHGEAAGPLSAAVHDCLGSESVLPVWQYGVSGRPDRPDWHSCHQGRGA